jgi:hypothetical protein
MIIWLRWARSSQYGLILDVLAQPHERLSRSIHAGLDAAPGLAFANTRSVAMKSSIIGAISLAGSAMAWPVVRASTSA